MEKVIEIDLLDKYDLVEKYNEKQVSRELIKYLIGEAEYVNKKDTLKIEISKKFQSIRSCKNLIVDGLKREYDESMKLHRTIDLKQWFFLVWGIVSLILANLLGDFGIIKELLVISAWVPIWEMIDLEIFSDHDERKKRRVLKKLLNAEFIER